MVLLFTKLKAKGNHQWLRNAPLKHCIELCTLLSGKGMRFTISVTISWSFVQRQKCVCYSPRFYPRPPKIYTNISVVSETLCNPLLMTDSEALLWCSSTDTLHWGSSAKEIYNFSTSRVWTVKPIFCMQTFSILGHPIFCVSYSSRPTRLGP